MKTFITAAFAALAIAASPAAAKELTTTSIAVPYGDLDLSAPAGQATFEARLNAAIANACGAPSKRDLKSNAAWQECRTTARTGAMEQMAIAAPFEGMELAGAF